MKPLILEYAETPTGKPLDFSMVEYSAKQNLTVLKDTDVPAVKFMPLDTNTFTKTQGESSDSDAQTMSLLNELNSLLDTSTKTRTVSEASDSDNGMVQGIDNLKAMLDTTTKTFTNAEVSDSDDRIKALVSLLDTKTLTENVENSDSDR